MVGTHLDDDRHDTSWHRFVTRARTAIARWNEMRRLDASEVEAIARDLNLSASELSALELSAPTSLEPLNLRLAKAGMNESELAATDCGVLRDLQRCAANARQKPGAPSISSGGGERARQNTVPTSRRWEHLPARRGRPLGSAVQLPRRAGLISINPCEPRMCFPDRIPSAKEVAP
jgi:hypothetical protein